MKFSIFSIIFCSLLLVGPFSWSSDYLQGVEKPPKPMVEVDVSGSSGNYNGQTYTEMHVGVNLNFTDWLTWRNSGFKRFGSSGAQDITGLDSSLRLTYEEKFDLGAIQFFAGPGYRWASPSSKNAVLGEAGASLSLGGLTVGAGTKYLRYDQAQFDTAGNELKRDDLSYFITISGGAGTSF